MKLLFAPIVALLAFAAQAQTTVILNPIDPLNPDAVLPPVGCGAGVWCSPVPNDAGLNLLLTGSQNYQNVTVSVQKPDGSSASYASLLYRGYSTIYTGTCPVRPKIGYMALSNGGNPVPMIEYLGSNIGSQASITAVFTCTRFLGGSGRGQGWHQSWTLVSGTLTLP